MDMSNATEDKVRNYFRGQAWYWRGHEFHSYDVLSTKTDELEPVGFVDDLTLEEGSNYQISVEVEEYIAHRDGREHPVLILGYFFRRIHPDLTSEVIACFSTLQAMRESLRLMNDLRERWQ